MNSNPHNIANLATEIIRALMVLLFVYTGISKLIAAESFLLQINAAPYLADYAQWLYRLIPISELIIATTILFKSTRLAGYYAFTFLMICFTIYICVMLLSGNPLPCSCGGVIRLMSWREHLAFNCCFIGLSIVAIYLQKAKSYSNDPSL